MPRLLVLLAMLVAIAIACSSEDDGADGNGDGDIATDTPTYRVALRQDVRGGGTVRIVYRVSVNGPLTEPDLRAVAQEIIDDETASNDVNAIGFFFFLPGTDITGAYTAGAADWAPDGDWSKADSVQAGDYSDHELGAIIVGDS